MIKCSVLKSFLGATQGSLTKDEISDETQSGTSDYFDPGHENTVLAPYNYNFT
ncbi:MAG TPA: hypothetical protein PLF01_01760 [Alphaproteobacteria bacterium]|nr:hypothetical protein [Alphaproteobacteria bacterium]